ncbi:hypothetical protein TNCT_308971 [Trichonephila clavata]|uniref:Uncharacterized protein n=1 Tax=Trichonephila clavata TaxID=2740835 RepID=A0A8X6KJU0_TRICU|nr:hypothetical protein TNCT_308971 [Trichonephila clavata]
MKIFSSHKGTPMLFKIKMAEEGVTKPTKEKNLPFPLLFRYLLLQYEPSCLSSRLDYTAASGATPMKTENGRINWTIPTNC